MRESSSSKGNLSMLCVVEDGCGFLPQEVIFVSSPRLKSRTFSRARLASGIQEHHTTVAACMRYITNRKLYKKLIGVIMTSAW